MKNLNLIALILVIIGALNWGLVGLAGIDLVVLILGSIPILVKTVYILVGLSGLLVAVNFKKLSS